MTFFRRGSVDLVTAATSRS